MPSSTAPLQSLSLKIKSRHSLHALNLNVENGRAECGSARQEAEANNELIAKLEDDERTLKMTYVEAKLAVYEKMHALKYSKQQELKQTRLNQAGRRQGERLARRAVRREAVRVDAGARGAT